MYRVCLLVLCLITTHLAVPAQAQSSDPDAQLRTFAACVGRLSAVAEYEWNTIGVISSETAQKRTAVVEIVAAIIPAEKSRDVLYWRNAAKQAQWNLLSRAASARDQAEANWAMQQAAQFENACASLLTL